MTYLLATVVDACDPNPMVTCNPPSGDLYPVGTTTVTCTATDAGGNSSQCTFNITVLDDFSFSGKNAVVPGPATLSLMGLGFAGLIITRRRKTRNV